MSDNVPGFLLDIIPRGGHNRARKIYLPNYRIMEKMFK